MTAKWTQHVTDTTQGQVSWWESTPTDQAPEAFMILLHGFTDFGQCWHPFAEYAGWTQRYRIITPDAFGHGDTPLRQSGTSLGMNLAALHELFVTLGWEPSILMGHSMGALNASQFAAAYPEKVRALIVEDPVWRFGQDLTADRRLQDGTEHPLMVWLKALQKHSIADRHRVARLENPRWSMDEVVPWALSKDKVDTRLFDGVVQWATESWLDTAAKIVAPTLVITGDPALGAIVADGEVDAALAVLARGERAHIPEAGHCVHRDQPAASRHAVNDFLARSLTASG